MKTLYQITITNNVKDAKPLRWIVGKFTYNKIVDMQDAGGFKRYSVDVYDIIKTNQNIKLHNHECLNYVKKLLTY